MSDGDDEDTPALDPDTFESRLDEAAEALEAAETEADLDEVDATLEGIAGDLEEADLEDEDEERAEELAERLDELETKLEEAQGPYADEIAATLEDAVATIRETRWTESGRTHLRVATVQFLRQASSVLETLGDRVDPIAVDAGSLEDVEEVDGAASVADTDAETPAADEDLADALATAAEVIADAGLDPDQDADALETLADASDAVDAAVDAAEEYDDLTVRGQLQADGFYDSLGQKHKDFPPEWTALKQWEQENNVEMILLGLEKMDSEFMERHCLESLERMGHPGAIDAMLSRAERRDKDAIRVLGTIGEPREAVLETLHEFLDGDPALVRETMLALGRIGSESSTQPVANLLVHEESTVRSQAARSLGLIGDERAVDPLEEVLDDTEETPSVRASAAWALVQIGTERALAAAADHASDRAFVVEAAAEPAEIALDRASS